MTVRGGSIIHEGRNFLIDRIQNASAQLGLPEEKIRELGNRLAVATIRDTPDITFNLESFDYEVELEALLCRVDPTTVTAGQEFDLITNNRPIDILSPYIGEGAFSTVMGIALPYLYLDRIDWRFGVRESSIKRVSLRGDSIYYIPGSPYYQRFTAAGVGPYAFTNPPALLMVEQGKNLYALCVTAFYSDGTFERLFVGEGYTNTTTGFTLTTAPPAGTVLEVVYGSDTASTYAQSTHPAASVKPAAIRGRDVDVYLSDGAATPTLVRVQGLQSAEVSLQLTSTVTEELGNPHAVSRDAEDPAVSGTLTMRPKTAQYLMDIIARIANVPANQIVGAQSSTPLQMQIRVNHPDTGVTFETLQIDDARVVPPGHGGQVNQPVENQFPFTSDAGKIRVFKGVPA